MRFRSRSTLFYEIKSRLQVYRERVVPQYLMPQRLQMHITKIVTFDQIKRKKFFLLGQYITCYLANKALVQQAILKYICPLSIFRVLQGLRQSLMYTKVKQSAILFVWSRPHGSFLVNTQELPPLLLNATHDNLPLKGFYFLFCTNWQNYTPLANNNGQISEETCKSQSICGSEDIFCLP